MKALLHKLLLLVQLGLFTGGLMANDYFYAYYTKVRHSSTDYVSKYADLIVVVGKGKQLEFTRRTQYLPKWVTPEGEYMVDDFFPDRDPDFRFYYNYVRLLESSSEKIVVHWRYIPNLKAIDEANARLDPTFKGGFTGVVHETFTIFPSGRVEREIKDAHESNYYSWVDEDFADRQKLELTNIGVIHHEVEWGDKSSLSSPTSEKSLFKSRKGMEKPVLLWQFDEGGGAFSEETGEEILELLEEDLVEKTIESEKGGLSQVLGHGKVYKKGVSGTSLAFDGYYTGVVMNQRANILGTTYFEEASIPVFEKAISAEAWLALDAFPYNEAPVLHQSQNFGEKGYYLGIDAYGHLFFRVNGNTVKTASPIQLYQWTHVVGTLGEGQLRLFVNGKELASTPYNTSLGKQESNLFIGLNSDKSRCTDFVRSNQQNLPFLFGIQGLLDEVALYKHSLSAKEVLHHYEAFAPKDPISPLQKAVLPGEVGVAEHFGATYKNLKHHELWDKMWRLHDQTNIVVKFDDRPTSIIYWHGTNFAANYVTDNNRWMADQSSEIFTAYGCSEHMGDKQTRHSYARIIENNPARVVVHWRYPCVDVGYLCTHRRNWTDEFHTIYPDGSAIRQVKFNKNNPPGFQDIQFFTNPGEDPLDVVNLNAAMVANTKGETAELVWEMPNLNPPIELEDATIEWLNTKSDWKVFAIFKNPGISTWGNNEQSKHTQDPFAGPWNHWPVSILPSDGRYAVANDRVTHFALMANDYAADDGVVHYGFTKQPIASLVPKARFWQNAPEVKGLEGIETVEFDMRQKAYHMKIHSSQKLRFQVEASTESPLVNPAFVLSTCESDPQIIRVNGKQVARGKDLRIGMARDIEGKAQRIIWIRCLEEKPIEVEFIF